jgi:hypothetical protein
MIYQGDGLCSTVILTSNSGTQSGTSKERGTSSAEYPAGT